MARGEKEEGDEKSEIAVLNLFSSKMTIFEITCTMLMTPY